MVAATRSAKRSWAARLAADAAVVTCIGRPSVRPATASVVSSFGRQLAAEPEARVHVGPPDPRVRPDPGEHLVDVGPGLLAQRGDLVRERQLEGEERVRAVLDDLGRLDVDDQARRLDRVVQRQDRRRARSGSASRNRPMTIRVGRAKSSTAVPWRRNSGLVKTRAVGSPVASTARRVPPTGSVLRMTRMSSGPNRVADRGERAVELAEVARGRRRRSGVPTHIEDDPRVGRHGIAVTSSRPAATAASNPSWRPASWIGIRPARSAASRVAPVSTRWTRWPSPASPTALTRPT